MKVLATRTYHLVWKTIKIVQLSDIHIGPSIDLDDFDEILKLALLQKPNRVVITGDLIDKLAWLPQVCERLTTFAKQIPDGVDFILGNHEYHHDVNKVLDSLKRNTPMNILMNSNIQIMGGKQPVYIAGVAYDNDRKKDNREAMINKALSGIPDYAFVILLAITLNSSKNLLNERFRWLYLDIPTEVKSYSWVCR